MYDWTLNKSTEELKTKRDELHKCIAEGEALGCYMDHELEELWEIDLELRDRGVYHD